MRSTLALLLLLPATVASAGVPETVDPTQIPNYKVIAPGIVAAGQPAAEVLPKLGTMGFKTVLNIRTPGEGGPDERAVVEGGLPSRRRARRRRPGRRSRCGPSCRWRRGAPPTLFRV